VTARVYLSGVASRTHLLYAGSYLRHLLEVRQDRLLVHDLGLRPFLGEHHVTDDDLAALLPQDPRITLETGPDGEPAEERIYVAVGAPGIKPLLRLRAAHPLRALRVVVVDEGLGSYGDWHSRRDAWRREGHAAWWATTRAVTVTTARRVLTDERWAMYREEAGRWALDERAATELRRPTGPPPSRPPYAVLLSQPFVQLGLMSADEAAGFQRGLSAAVTAAGLDLLVRPHPAEAALRVEGVEPVSSSTPAEIDPVVRGATAVLGTATTGLLNVAALGLAPAIRLDVPGVRASEAALSATQRSLLSAFLPPAVPVTRVTEALAALR
jgi:hypothetical protein